MLFVGILGISAVEEQKPVSRSLRSDQRRQDGWRQCVYSHTERTQENGWLMAAGIALQYTAKHIEVIPLKTIMNEIAIEWCDLLIFQSKFIGNGDAEERDVSWRTSDWNKGYLRHPEHYKTADWLIMLNSNSFASNPMAQLLAIDKVYNRRGFELSEKVKVKVSSEAPVADEPVLDSVLQESKRKSALVLFGDDDWEKVRGGSFRRSDLDVSPLMVMIPSIFSHHGYYDIKDTCGISREIPEGSNISVRSDYFRGRNFEIWFVDVLETVQDKLMTIRKRTHENGWLMAAGIALQHAETHIEVIPLETIMNEIAMEWCDLLEFQSVFIENGNSQKRDDSGRTSDWNEVYLRHPEHYKTTDWLMALSSKSFPSNPMAQLLAIEKVFNQRGFQLSDRVQVRVPSKEEVHAKAVVDLVLKQLKRKSALVLFGDDEWQKLKNSGSDLDISPLMALTPSTPSHQQDYAMKDTCGLASKIPDGSDLPIPSNFLRTRNFEVWFVQPLAFGLYGSRVQELENVQGEMIKLQGRVRWHSVVEQIDNLRSEEQSLKQQIDEITMKQEHEVTTTVVTVIIDEVVFHSPQIQETGAGGTSPESMVESFPSYVKIAVPDLKFESFIHSLRSRILLIFLQIDQNISGWWNRDKLPERRINSIKDLADVFLEATPGTMYKQSMDALLSYGIDGENIKDCGNALFDSRPEGPTKEWISMRFTVLDKPVSRPLLSYRRDPVGQKKSSPGASELPSAPFEAESLLQSTLDLGPSNPRDIDQQREERLKQCVYSKTQRTHENGWLMAAGIALQSAARHTEVIPLQSDIINEIAMEWCHLVEIQSEFIKNRDSERDVSWRYSDWSEVYLRHSEHYKTTDWLDILSSSAFASNPMAHLLVIEKVYNRRGFELSERTRVQVPSEEQVQNEPVLASVLTQLKRKSALVLFGDDEWQKVRDGFSRRSDLDVSPLMVVTPSPHIGHYDIKDTCGISRRIAGSNIPVETDFFRGGNFEIWFADIQTSSDKWYPSRVQELETVQGEKMKLQRGAASDPVEEIHRLKDLEQSLENQIDEITMKQEPAVPRSISSVARNHGNEPICWMFAAATLLRSRQRKLTPFAELISQLKQIQSDSIKFAEELNKRHDPNEGDARQYWIDIEWYRMAQTPGIQQIWYAYEDMDWIVGMITQIKVNRLPSKGLNRLMLQKFFNSHGFQFSARTEILNDVYISDTARIINKERKEKLKTWLATNEHALISLSGHSWDRINPKRLSKNPPTKFPHILVLDSFDEKQNQFILINFHGSTGGSAEDKGGRIRVSEDRFFTLEPLVYTVVPLEVVES